MYCSGEAELRGQSYKEPRALRRLFGGIVVGSIALALGSTSAVRAGSADPNVKSCPKEKYLAHVFHGPNHIVTWTMDSDRMPMCEFSIDGYTKFGRNYFSKNFSMYASAIVGLRKAFRQHQDASKVTNFKDLVQRISSNIVYALAAPEMTKDGQIDSELSIALKNNDFFIEGCVQDFYARKFLEGSRISKDEVVSCRTPSENPIYMETMIKYGNKVSATYFAR